MKIKQRFFTFRNGLLADMLRRQGVSPHRTIFGLNVIQLREIAAETGCNPGLAEELWADTSVRESRLLAPMIAEPTAESLGWLDQVQSAEEADLLCHSLLRRCPGAFDAATARLNDDRPLVQYGALRLLLNLANSSNEVRQRVEELLDACRPLNSMNAGVADQLRQLLSDYEENTL